jgi:hypothetical protein
LAEVLPDRRDPDRITHSLESLLQQRLYGLALGYEDLNDHDALRHDVVWQTAAERDEALGGSSTLCRWENRAGRQEAWRMHQVLFEQFVGSFDTAPEELILDFDATDDRVHGAQAGAFFNGYYRDYCFLPLYVFCGEQLLVSYLRPSNLDAARHAWAVLALLVKALRRHWPQVRILLRADSGFCRWRLFRWCERHGVDYLVGLAKNTRLNALSAEWQAQAAAQHQALGEEVRLFGEFAYKAHPWDRERRVIVKAEHNAHGPNPRYLVTCLDRGAQELYEVTYCARGEMENQIKAQQTRSFQRPHQLPRVVGQPIPRAAVRQCPPAPGSAAPLGLGRHRTGAGPGGDHPAKAAQGRHGRGPQHPAGAALVFLRFPVARNVSSVPGVLLRLSPAWCWPRHPLKNGGHARGVP